MNDPVSAELNLDPVHLSHLVGEYEKRLYERTKPPIANLLGSIAILSGGLGILSTSAEFSEPLFLFVPPLLTLMPIFALDANRETIGMGRLLTLMEQEIARGSGQRVSWEEGVANRDEGPDLARTGSYLILLSIVVFAWVVGWIFAVQLELWQAVAFGFANAVCGATLAMMVRSQGRFADRVDRYWQELRAQDGQIQDT